MRAHSDRCAYPSGWPGCSREVAVTIMTEGRGFSNATAKRELGWELRYPSWRQGFKDGLA